MAIPPATVLIADDHPLFRAALADLIQRTPEFQLVGAVEALEPAVTLLAAQPCDLALLDLRMPGMTDLSVLGTIRTRYPDTKLALISGNLDSDAVAGGLRNGIVGFLPKSFDPPVILAAIRLILSGAIYVPHELAAFASDAAAPASPAGNGIEPTPLTEREHEILTMMVAGSSHKEIARSLDLAEITIKLHAQRIVKKLGVRNRAAAIAKAVRDRLVEPPL
ncbi:MAG TPA: response regulator transcription factor [Hypericibacter adhaerens]|uniref:DNA-binding response regulator n=1 Tax=Hypericibacter adhaerens TaxID=2602016 RepID=A0A5J6N550_9PROT|nr:response regulator transcription factor [Hypericibacter adhaerens]QEX24557.1 DNA-binding response regulator [Hypericibacter adhaerens]HWA43590.1 response regulator transcription factor [Hypericibacter adhaerens]